MSVAIQSQASLGDVEAPAVVLRLLYLLIELKGSLAVAQRRNYHRVDCTGRYLHLIDSYTLHGHNLRFVVYFFDVHIRAIT